MDQSTIWMKNGIFDYCKREVCGNPAGSDRAYFWREAKSFQSPSSYEPFCNDFEGRSESSRPQSLARMPSPPMRHSSLVDLQHLLLLALCSSTDCYIHQTIACMTINTHTCAWKQSVDEDTLFPPIFHVCRAPSASPALNFRFLLTVGMSFEKLSCQRMRHTDKCYCTSALTHLHPPACENTHHKWCYLLLCRSCTKYVPKSMFR